MTTKNTKDPTAVLERLEWWSFGAAIAVVAGIAIEAAEAIIFKVAALADEALMLSSDALVGVGVAVEAVCVVRAIVWTRREKKESDERIAQLEFESGFAEERIAQANARAAEAGARAAEALEAAERERLARVKIEARLAPRKLSSEQQHDIAEQIKEFKGQKAQIGAWPSEPETELFKRQIAVPLANAGWEIIAEIMPLFPMKSPVKNA